MRKGLIKDKNAEDVEAPPPTTNKSKDKGGKDKKPEKGDKGKQINEEEEPDDSVKWVEYDIDPVSHKYLPRIVIPKVINDETSEAATVVNGDSGVSVTDKATHDGFEPWRSNRKLEVPFVSFWTEEQRKRSEIDRMLAESNLPTSYDKLVNEARRKGIPPPEPPKAEGPFKDELMVSVFNGVAQMASLVERAFASGGGNGISPNHGHDMFDSVTLSPTGSAGGGVASPTTASSVESHGNSIKGLKGKPVEGDNFPFMWDAIYPKDTNGKPCYNPKGIYVVRVWAAGAWRAVVVNDEVPLNFKVS